MGNGFYVVGKTLNLGYPGTVSRLADAIIENRAVNSSSADIPFGAPVVLNTDNTWSLWGGSNVAADFAGIAVREVKQSTDYLTTSSGSYSANQPCDVLQRGSCTVTCTEGTPTAGGAVYVVTTVASSGGVSGTVVGSFIANSAPAGTGGAAVKLTGAQWKNGNIDAYNTAELTILSRNKA